MKTNKYYKYIRNNIFYVNLTDHCCSSLHENGKSLFWIGKCKKFTCFFWREWYHWKDLTVLSRKLNKITLRISIVSTYVTIHVTVFFLNFLADIYEKKLYQSRCSYTLIARLSVRWKTNSSTGCTGWKESVTGQVP